MQLKSKTFGGALVVALVVGIAVGALAATRGPWRPAPLLAQAPPALLAPILPVQMPLTTGTFAKVAEAIKPAVVNINTVSRAVAAAAPSSRSSSARSSSAGSSATYPSGSRSAAWARASSSIPPASR